MQTSIRTTETESGEIDFPIQGLTLLKAANAERVSYATKQPTGTILCSEFEKIDQMKPVFDFKKYHTLSFSELQE